MVRYKCISFIHAYLDRDNEASVQPTRNGVNRCYKRGLQKERLGVNASQTKAVCVSLAVCVEYNDSWLGVLLCKLCCSSTVSVIWGLENKEVCLA